MLQLQEGLGIRLGMFPVEVAEPTFSCPCSWESALGITARLTGGLALLVVLEVIQMVSLRRRRKELG